MAILTTPVFYYVDQINSSNFLINFKEPNISSAELTAELNAGGYSLTELGAEVARALNAAGQQEYTATFDRDTRKFTFTSTDTFELLASSGSAIGTSPFSILGFDAIDKTGASSYESDSASGTEYTPQFPLQEFVGFEDQIDAILPSVNESASGTVEILTYGNRQLMNFSIKYITDNPQSSTSPITNNANAVQEVRDFLTFAITKSNIEFMKDSSNRSAYDIILLERTRSSRTGTGFTLRELYNQNLIGFYETGDLRFRKVG